MLEEGTHRFDYDGLLDLVEERDLGGVVVSYGLERGVVLLEVLVHGSDDSVDLFPLDLQQSPIDLLLYVKQLLKTIPLPHQLEVVVET